MTTNVISENRSTGLYSGKYMMDKSIVPYLIQMTEKKLEMCVMKRKKKKMGIALSFVCRNR